MPHPPPDEKQTRDRLDRVVDELIVDGVEPRSLCNILSDYLVLCHWFALHPDVVEEIRRERR